MQHNFTGTNSNNIFGSVCILTKPNTNFALFTLYTDTTTFTRLLTLPYTKMSSPKSDLLK